MILLGLEWSSSDYSSQGSFVFKLLSHAQPFATPWTAARQASLSFTISQSLLKLMSVESVMPFNHLVLCCPLLLLPSIFPSIRVFLDESPLYTRWPKHWSSSFSISPSNEHSGLISFRMDWLDLLVALYSVSYSCIYSEVLCRNPSTGLRLISPSLFYITFPLMLWVCFNNHPLDY